MKTTGIFPCAFLRCSMLNENKTYSYEDLIFLLEQKKYTDLMRRIDTLPPIDAANFLTSIDGTYFPIVFRLLKKDTAAKIFAELDPDRREELINGLTDRELSPILNELFVDDTVDMLEEMPAGMVTRIMKIASPETRAEINRFLAYPIDSAGSVMTSEFLDLKRSMTCSEAIEKIRRIGLEKETVYVAYVINSERVLEGVVPLKKLLFASADAKIGEIMDQNVVFGYTHDDRETVARMISHYDLLAIPIVDKERRLVGLVTVDDALDVLRDEDTEDIERMAAILPTDKPYMRTGIWETWKKRIPWLLLLMISATFTGAIITHYETAIGKYAILTAFFPMLMDTGGNAGGQTSVTIIRALSLGEISPRDIFRILRKELCVALLCGITLSAVTFLKIMAIDFRFTLQSVTESGIVQNNLAIALVVSVTVLFSIPIAKLVGTLLPLGAKKIGMDPAVMASPFITTIVDIAILFLYFSIAARVIGF